MHIPDGLLDIYTIAWTYAVALAVLTVTMLKLRRLNLDEEIPKIAALSASIFVAQLIKWPVPGGSTLHFVGAGLADIIVGPFEGVIVMTTVLAVQTFVFHDGGITTFGANVLSMCIMGVFASHVVYALLRRYRAPLLFTAFIVGYIGTLATGIVAGFVLGLSGEILGSTIYNLSITVPVMTVTHGSLGLLEGVITSLIVLYIRRKNPSLLSWGV